jgi:hypothetical protein
VDNGGARNENLKTSENLSFWVADDGIVFGNFGC